MKKLNLELNLFDGEASTDGAPSEMAAPAADAQPQNADIPPWKTKEMLNSKNSLKENTKSSLTRE